MEGITVEHSPRLYYLLLPLYGRTLYQSSVEFRSIPSSRVFFQNLNQWERNEPPHFFCFVYFA